MKEFLKKERPENYNKDFLIGWFMGEIAWSQTIPTLSHHPCQSEKVIEVSEEDIKFETELLDIWFKTQRKEDWEEYREAAKLIEEKYLPKEVTHSFDSFVEMNEDVLKGLQSYLWNTDGCPYSCNPDDFKVEHVMDYWTQITFTYKP